MNQKQLLLWGEKTLKEFKVQDAHIKAKKLLEFILKQNSQQLVVNSLEEVSQNNEANYKLKLEEIIKGKPLQYITHKQEFMGLDFYVDENVLIPQPDTEILVEATIKIIGKNSVNLKSECVEKEEIIKKHNTENSEIKILDLCTGSGCIGISLAKLIENSVVTASDVSKEALEIAKKNAVLNGVEQKIEFVQSNLFENIHNEFDYIVSNPPYIETKAMAMLPLEVKNEPVLALDGGEKGLKYYKEILKDADKYLTQNGYLILEIGYNQGEWLKNMCSSNLTLVTENPIKDLGGNDRVVIFKKM